METKLRRILWNDLTNTFLILTISGFLLSATLKLQKTKNIVLITAKQ